jgi:ABC-type dipeptide/oligopeptide/nickel transport system ATPase component
MSAARSIGTEGAALRIEGLTISFPEGDRRKRVVEDVHLAAHPGRTVALVGESGCGKSVTAMSVLRLLPEPPARIEAGRAVVATSNGEVETLGADRATLRRVRGGGAAMIFQEPMTSLNPVMTIGEQLAEAARLHRGVRGRRALDLAAEALSEVQIRDARARLRSYPHQFSGGMRQRVMIAMAMLCRPRVLLADEPTTALDVTVQAQILDLIDSARSERGMSVLLITHDLGVVSDRADEVCVMYAGRIVEQGPTSEVLSSPLHPYTRALLASIPTMRGVRRRLRTVAEIVSDPRAFEGAGLRGARAWWPWHDAPEGVERSEGSVGESALVEASAGRRVRVWRQAGVGAERRGSAGAASS